MMRPCAVVVAITIVGATAAQAIAEDRADRHGAPSPRTTVGRAAASGDLRCPETIDTEQRLASPAAGWTAAQRRGTGRLVGVTFFDGAPADEASLVYDDTATKGDEWIAIWHFAPNTTRGYWITCGYSGTTIELARALPASITVCRVVYDKRILTDPSRDEVKRIACE